MKKSKQIFALLLAVLMLLPTLAACKQEMKESEDEAKEAITATSVQYSKNGKYTTTISSDQIKLEGLTVENVEVRYMDPNAALTVDELAASLENGVAETTVEETFPLTAVIDSVKANENGGYDISFTDKNAEIYATEAYYIALKSLNADSHVSVDFPTITLTPDIENVYIGTEEFRVALTIDGAEFEDSLSEEDLYQDNAFGKADVEILSKSNRNLTLKVSGKMTKNEADAYQWGILGVKATGIKNGYADVPAKINVKMNYADFDGSTLAYADGKITANLKVYGVADVDGLTEDNVSVEGVTVEDLAKEDDNTVRVTLSAEGVANVNDFADLINSKKLTLGSYETEILLSQATFYPVFDYIEKDGDNFDLTLKLYIYGGTIDGSTLTAERIGFGDSFANATVKSVTVDADNLATLVITVPAGGQTESNYVYDGAVTLKAGAVTNAWGEKTSSDYTYTRNYSAESLGRDVTLNTDTLLEIQKYTEGLNTTFGKICHYAGIAGQVYSIGKSILEATGIVKSEHAQVMEQLALMDQKLDNIQAGISDIKQSIGDLVLLTTMLAREEEKRELKSKIDDFETMLLDFNNTIDVVKAIQQRAALDMALEKEGVTPNYTGKTAEELAAYKAELRKQYLPDEDVMTDAEAAQYNVDVMNYLNNKASDPNNSDYYSYNTYVQELESTFKTICGLLDKPTASNPIGFYDELCSYTYNFDSQTYDFRLANRIAMQYNLTDAIAVLAFHFKVAANPDSDRYALIGAAYNKAMASSIWTVSGHPASEIKANPHIAQSSEAIFISDIKISGAQASAEEAKQYLIDEGYTVYDLDLNRGTKGCYIYLGYKTTDKFSEAISDLYLVRKYTESITVEGLGTGYPADYTGDEFFKGLPGNLNRGCGGSARGIYLYYFKNTAETNKAITNMNIIQNSSGAEGSIPHVSDLNGDLNQGAGGYYEFIHVSYGKDYGLTADQVNTMVETDTEYYPYCYTLGCKVSIFVTAEGVDNRSEIDKSKEWTITEIDEFQSRMKYWYLHDEFTSAGLKWDFTINGSPFPKDYLHYIVYKHSLIAIYNWPDGVKMYWIWSNTRAVDGVRGGNSTGMNVLLTQGGNVYIIRH